MKYRFIHSSFIPNIWLTSDETQMFFRKRAEDEELEVTALSEPTSAKTLHLEGKGFFIEIMIVNHLPPTAVKIQYNYTDEIPQLIGKAECRKLTSRLTEGLPQSTADAEAWRRNSAP